VKGNRPFPKKSLETLSIGQSIALIQKIAMAIAHAHDRGILHRDIKPANILINETGDPIVTDFGLGKKIESSVQITQSGDVLGTPAYMSPEQASGKISEIDERTDIYSLGALFYHMLTGSPPFASQGGAHLILYQVVHKNPTSIRKKAPHVDRDLALIFYFPSAVKTYFPFYNHWFSGTH